MCSNIANTTLVSRNLELQKMDKKPNICCKYYLSPDWLRIDVDIFALLVSIGLVHSWVSWCACYYPQANACSALGRFCLLIYGNTQFQRPKSSLGRKSIWVRSPPYSGQHSSIISTGAGGRLHAVASPCRGVPAAQGFACCCSSAPKRGARWCWGDVLFLGGVWQPVWGCWMRALCGEAPGHCPVGQWRCMKSEDSRKRGTALPGGSDTRSASVCCGSRNSSLACGAQFFCTFTSTPDVLWE